MNKVSLKYKILLNFTLIFLLVFIVMFISFQLITRQYITMEAKNELSAANNVVKVLISKNGYTDLNKLPSALKIKLRSITKVSKNIGNTNFMIISQKKGKILYPGKAAVSEDEAELSNTLFNALNDQLQNYEYTKPFKLSTADREFFVSVFKPKVSQNEIIFYTDVTMFENFVKKANTVLFTVFLIGWVLTIGCGLLISTRISKPVNELCRYAHTVGRGQFELTQFDFKDTEFVQLANDMNQMTLRLKDYDTEQKQFFQNVSHDLRTPLMSIQGYAEGIMHGVFKKPPEIAGIIVNECERLTSMVNDLLLLSKLESGTLVLNMEELNLFDLIESAVRSTNGLAIKQNKRIVYNGESQAIYIKGDEQSLLRAFLNLLSNCIRYAKEIITISIKIEEEKIKVSIKDDGKGFTQDDLKNLFKRHYKGASGEFGIGLSIVKAVFDCHNASIYPQNNFGGEFVIEFAR